MLTFAHTAKDADEMLWDDSRPHPQCVYEIPKQSKNWVKYDYCFFFFNLANDFRDFAEFFVREKEQAESKTRFKMRDMTWWRALPVSYTTYN